MRYRILGATEAYDDEGAPLPVGGRRLRSLLAALALSPGRTVPTQTLIAEVWAADEPPADAPAALQALIGRLRRALGKDAVTSAPGGYSLDATPEDVDLHRFERLVREGKAALARQDPATAARTLREALTLWRGPALADLPDRSAAARPEALLAEATRVRVESDLLLGHASDVVPELRELTAAHPYDEALHALLIRALRDAGRGAEALAAYETARRTLADALGADPGPELRALYAALLDPGPGSTVAATARDGGPTTGLSKRPEGGGGPERPERPERGGRSERPEGAEWAGRLERAEQAERAEWVGRLERAEQPEQPEQAERARRAEQFEWSERSERTEQRAEQRAERPGRAGRLEWAGQTERAEWAGRLERAEQAEQAEQAERTERGGRSERPEGAEWAGRLERAEQAERAGRAEQFEWRERSERPEQRAEQRPERPEQRPERPEQRPERVERTGNLRPRLTSFVGREPELAAIRSDIRRARLVTLTGPGGSGKTRLAEEAAAGHPQAWLAELAPLDHPEAVPGAVVSALGLRETVLMTSEMTVPQDDPSALLIEYCAPRSLLLLLDNCEHVIGAAADLAHKLLTHCPDLTVVATSREPLGVPGEFVRPVEPLPPDPAHRLFTERATAVRPDFDPARDPAAVAEICRRLDGLPLAIELAAARLRLLTPRQIADRLDDRFRLLTSGSRTVLPRQQTLRAVVDWSWDLLDEPERTVLREVSLFAGGWDLAAAEAVCTGAVADLIGALVDKSLLIAEPTARGGMRYRMLETIHEYATERAGERPELRTAAAHRHTAYFRALVEQADPLLRSGEQLPWIQRLETELDNIRAALHRTIEAGEAEEALAVGLGMGWFWWLRNYRREAMEWVTRLLSLAPPMPPEGPDAAPDGNGPDDPLHWSWMSLHLLHIFLEVDTRPSEAMSGAGYRAYVAQVRDAFARSVPAAARFPGLIWPFTTFFLDGPDAARPAMDEVVANCRRHGGDWEVGVSLMFRTHLAVDAPGNLSGVDEDLAELRVLSRRAGDRWMRAQVSSAAGEAAMARSLHEEARVEYDEALRLAYEVGAYAETPFLLVRLAEIAYREGDRPVAAKILHEAGIEADRYGVADSRAFMRLLQTVMALDDGDAVQARALYEEACAEAARGTPPPQFNAALKGVESRVVAAESGPEQALPLLAEGLRLAMDHRCAEVIVAGLVDGGAAFASRLGDHPRAARLLACGTRLRSGYPRPMPELAEAEETETAALAALGPQRYEAERAAGAELTVDQALAELS